MTVAPDWLRARMGAVRFARTSGSSIAAPDAAGWVTDFLNAAYFARDPGERAIEDLRLAQGIVTTAWAAHPRRRLRLPDVAGFHRAFGVARFLDARTSRRATLDHEQLLAGAERLHGPWFGEAWADPARRAHGIAFPDAEAAAAFDPRVRLRHASLGALTPPEQPDAAQQWSTYPAVPQPSVAATAALLGETRRWPDFAAEYGRFTALGCGGLDGCTFEIEVVAQVGGDRVPLPVYTRGYVTCTRIVEDPHDEVAAVDEQLRAHDQPACLPDGARAALLVELTTHEGHFLGGAISRLVLFEHEGQALLRNVGSWDPLPWYLATPFSLAGREAQHAFWGGARPEQSLLHQIAAVAAAGA